MKRTVQGVGALSLALGMCWLVGCQTMVSIEMERETILQTLNGYKAHADGKTYADGYDYLKNLTVLLWNRDFLEQQRSAWCVSWSEARINELVEQTRARLLKKDVAGARAYVYGFGIVGVPKVDNAVAVVKVRILDSWINPRECADILARNKSALVAATQSQTPVTPSLTPEQQKKLEELETLHTAGLCTDDEYERRRWTILTEK